jgi:hypothetical protein
MLFVRAGLVIVALVASDVRARADATVFMGVMTAGSPRPAIGFSVGLCPEVFGCFEIEIAGTIGAATSTRSSAGGINGSFIIQSPRPVHGVQFYGIAGVGLYGETYEGGVGSGEVSAKNFGGGTKIGLRGPLKLRLDYRVFVLGDAPDAATGVVVHQHPQRVSVGLSVAFFFSSWSDRSRVYCHSSESFPP